MEMSTGHSKVKVGGGALAAEEYQRREGRYRECGKEQVDAMSPVLMADAYQSREGDFAARNDLLEAKASVPKGAPEEWAEDSAAFWEAAEENERTRAFTRFAPDQSRCDAWREANAGVAMSGVIAQVPEEIAGDARALDLWVAEQTKAFHRGVTGQSLRDSPLVCKIRVETDGRDQQPVALRWEVQSRAEWMASEGDIAFRFHVSIDNRFTEDEAKDLAARIRERMTEKHGLYCSTAIHWKEGNHHIHGLYNLRRIDETGNFGEARITRTPKDWARWNKDQRRFFAEIQNEVLREKGLEPTVEWRSFKERGIDRAPTEHEGIRGRPATERKATAAAVRNDEKRAVLFLAALAEPETLLREVERTKATWTRDDLERSIAGTEGADQHEIESIFERALAHSDAVRLTASGMKGETVYTTRQYAATEARLLATIDRLVHKPLVSIAPELVEEVLARPEFERLSDQQRDAVRHCAEADGLNFVVGVAGSGKTTLSKAFTVAAQDAGHRVVAMAPTGAAADTLGAELGVPGKTIASYVEMWDKLDDLDHMLATGKVSDKERARMEAAMADKLKPLPPGVRRSFQRMLNTGDISKSRLEKLSEQRDQLAAQDIKAGDIVLVDESGLAGTVVMDRLTSRLEAIGAAGRLTGDPAQYAAIDAGQPFRVCVEKYGAAEVDAVIRQQHDILDCIMVSAEVDLAEAAQIAATLDADTLASIAEAWMPKAKEGKAWQQRASELFSKGEGAEALRMYMDAGRVRWTDTREEALDLTAEVTAAAASRHGAANVLSTAGTNVDVRTIHQRAQELVRERTGGTGGPSLTVDTVDREGKKVGPMEYRLGDRIGFLKNDNHGRLVPDADEGGQPAELQSGRGVRNGTAGTVMDITAKGALIVELDHTAADPAGRRVIVDPARYRNLSGALSLTGQRSQGSTATETATLMHDYTDSRGAYVTATRHRQQTTIIADRETFASDEELLRAVERGRTKTMVCDFAPISAEAKLYRDMVSAFATADAKNRALFRAIKEESKDQPAHKHERWTEYERGKEFLKGLAETVADNLSQCAPFLRGADLSEGAINIAAGRAEKVLSQGAEASRARMRVYAHSMNSARDTWNGIKETHPGARSRRHPDFTKFGAARDERDRLAAEVVKDPNFRKWTHEAGVSAATIEKHAAAHLERQAEASRVAELTGNGAELHRVAESYKTASAELRAELEILRGMGVTCADVEAQTVDRWAQQVRAAAAEMPDPEAAMEAEGLDSEAIHFAADRADARDAWARYQWHTSRGETKQADAVAEKIMTRTKAERPAAKPKEEKYARPRNADDAPRELDAVGTLDGAGTFDSLPEVHACNVAADEGRAEVLLPNHADAELPPDDAAHRDLRQNGRRIAGAPRPWTATVMRGGGDWQNLQDAADRYAVSNAPPAVKVSIQAVQEWIEARKAAGKLAPLKMDKGEHGPPMPPSAEYEAAQRAADAAACRATQRPATAAAVEWWNDRRRYPIDSERLEQAANRHGARLEMKAWQKAGALDPAAGAAVAASILDKARAERAGTGPKPWAGAIREDGRLWDALEVDARRHALSTSPPELQAARAAALAYLDAIGGTRDAEDKGEAWQKVDKAAADLTTQNGWREAVTFWDEYRTERFLAAKLTNADHIERAARQHQARDQVAAWQEAKAADNVIGAGTIASEILAQTEAERAAGKGAAHPYIAAVSAAGKPWPELKRSVEDAAVAATGPLAPTIRLARTWLDARAQAVRIQSQAAQAAGLEFGAVARSPEVGIAWARADALATFVRRPDAGPALDWLRGARNSVPTLDQTQSAQSRHFGRSLAAAVAGADTDAARKKIQIAAASLAAVDPVARAAMGRAGLDTSKARAMTPAAAVSMARHAGADRVRVAVAVVLDAADRQLSPQMAPTIVIDEEVLTLVNVPDIASIEPAQAPDAGASAAWEAEIKEMAEAPALPMLTPEQIERQEMAQEAVAAWEDAQREGSLLSATRYAATIVEALDAELSAPPEQQYYVAALAGSDMSALRRDSADYVPLSQVSAAIDTARAETQAEAQEEVVLSG